MKKVLPKKKYCALLLFFLVFIIYAASLINYSTQPIDGKNTQVVVDIPTGSSFLKLTEILNDAGIIKSRILFYGLAITRRALSSIRAGEYEFNTSMTPSAVITKLMQGEIKTYRVTIPEDLSLKEIAACFMEYSLIDEKVFFALAEDKEFLRSVGIEANSIEGYLFPETYYFDRSMSTRHIMRIMVNEFWKRVTPEMLGKAYKLGMSVQQYVTLASIIGKESSNYNEKPLISAVFYNRLKKKMRLQSDPTAVYDLDNFAGAVKRSHLKRHSPYNTYVINGLPPGPIANPGLDSLKAALYPANVDYLYFVLQGNGLHFFSSSLQMHNQAISRYRVSRSHN